MYIADYLSSVKTDKEVKTTSENLPEGKQGINGVDRNQTRGRTGSPETFLYYCQQTCSHGTHLSGMWLGTGNGRGPARSLEEPRAL